MYRDDEAARGARADALISEISDLERRKVARAEQDKRLDDARAELSSLQAIAQPEKPRTPGVFAHVAVFCVAAAATFAGYTLMF
jgi:hypothetical protein